MINMKTAKALGIEVPNSMQLPADEVIKKRLPLMALSHVTARAITDTTRATVGA